MYSYDDARELLDCIKNDNKSNKFDELKEYKDYIIMFYNNFKNNTEGLRLLINIIAKHPSKFTSLSGNFINTLINTDHHNYGCYTLYPIKALYLLFGEYPKLDYEYSLTFNLLLDCYEFYELEVLKNIKEYFKVIDSMKFKVCKNSDGNLQYNYHILLRYIGSYCYYNNINPEEIINYANFFIDNYDQIINILDVNQLNKDDLAISFEGEKFFINFYHANNEKTLKKIE